MTKNQNTASAWTSQALGWVLAVLSAMGLLASFQLLKGEITLLRDPTAALACDLNPLIGCSSGLLAPQGHLLIIPNAGVGLFLFGMLLALAAVLIGGAGLPRLVWWGLGAGSLVGLGYVAYFLIVSITVFRTLCPYCMVVWLAIMILVPLAWGGGMRAGAYGPGKEEAGKTVLKYSWAIALAEILIVVLTVLLGLSDKVALLFG